MKHDMHRSECSSFRIKPLSSLYIQIEAVCYHVNLLSQGQSEPEPWLDEMRSDLPISESLSFHIPLQRKYLLSLHAAIFDIFGKKPFWWKALSFHFPGTAK